MLQGEHSAILSTFIKLPFVIKIFVLSFFEWLLKTGCTVLTTYLYFLFWWVCRLPVRWIFLLKRDCFTFKKDGSTGPSALEMIGHILKSWDNDPALHKSEGLPKDLLIFSSTECSRWTICYREYTFSIIYFLFNVHCNFSAHWIFIGILANFYKVTGQWNFSEILNFI